MDILTTDLRHRAVIRSGFTARVAIFIVNFWFEIE